MTSVLLLILVSTAVLAVVVHGLAGPREAWSLETSAGRLSELTRRKERLLRVLKDLEQELEAGSIRREDYTALARDYKRRVAAVLRDLDRVRAVRVRRLGTETSSGGASDAKRQLVEDLVRERIRQREKES